MRKSLVLLKNGKKPDQPLLPLPKKARRILVAGTHADNLGYQCGGWTIQWQGVPGNNLTIGMFCPILSFRLEFLQQKLDVPILDTFLLIF